MTTRSRRNYVPDPTASPLGMSQFRVIYPHRQWGVKTWGELVRRDEILLVASGDEKPWGQPGLDYGDDGFDLSDGERQLTASSKKGWKDFPRERAD